MTHHHITLHTQAEFIPDAFLLGNGSPGATTSGRPGVERIDLNAETFWSHGSGDFAATEVKDDTCTRLRATIGTSVRTCSLTTLRAIQAAVPKVQGNPSYQQTTASLSRRHNRIRKP